MRTVSSCVSDREYAAIVEFANQYGETMSSAIKKAIFDVAALAREDCPSGFEYLSILVLSEVCIC